MRLCEGQGLSPGRAVLALLLLSLTLGLAGAEGLPAAPLPEAATPKTAMPTPAVSEAAPPLAATEMRAPEVLAPSTLRQGDPLFIAVKSESALVGRVELKGPKGGVLDSSALYALSSGASPWLYGALFALDFGAQAGTYTLVVEGTEEVVGASPQPFSLSFPLEVVAKQFFSESIKLNSSNTSIIVDPRQEAEAKAYYAVLGQVEARALYLDGGFIAPIPADTRRSAGFGDKRVYLHEGGASSTSVHAGIDFAVPVKTPVKACAAGRVVFAGPRIVTGNTIIVEHLPGFYSIYMHLSEADVAVGDLVNMGDLVGLSGSTGLSTGPHLHWELRIRGRAVDPDYWLGHGGELEVLARETSTQAEPVAP